MAKGWFVVHTYSGYEQKIERIIRKMRENDPAFAEVCLDVKVPFETTVEVKDGVKKETKHKVLPGYILVNMDLPENSWRGWCFQITRINGVTGFLTADADRLKPPVPLSEKEYKSILQKTGELPADQVYKPRQTFQVGDRVKITSGPFESFKGTVDEVNTEKSRLRISVGIFGRSTPVEVDFLAAEKDDEI